MVINFGMGALKNTLLSVLPLGLVGIAYLSAILLSTGLVLHKVQTVYG